MQSTPLQNITDPNVLSKILPGIAAPNLATIPHGLKVNTLVNLLAASLNLGIDLTSYQVAKSIFKKKSFLNWFEIIQFLKRAAMLSSLIGSLSVLNGSSDPNAYLKILTDGQIQKLYPLFIEST